MAVSISPTTGSSVIVTAIGFAEDPKIGLACVVFYLIYQQVENYVIYPKVMSSSVDVPGSVTVIAANFIMDMLNFVLDPRLRAA